MAKTIEHFSSVKLISITKLSSSHHNSGSRSDYIGHRGELFVIESQNRNPGKIFLRFTNHSTIRFSTGFGTYTVENGILKMKTEHSVYKFEIL